MLDEVFKKNDEWYFYKPIGPFSTEEAAIKGFKEAAMERFVVGEREGEWYFREGGEEQIKIKCGDSKSKYHGPYPSEEIAQWELDKFIENGI